MYIYFDPKTYQFLNTYMIKQGNIELELRFGYYEDGRFKPDIGIQMFNKLNTFLSSSQNIVHISKEESTSEILSSNIRKITNKDGSVKYERKTKLFTNDIEYNDFVLRISESQEIQVDGFINDSVVDIRRRNRILYYERNNAFYYVLTEVKTGLDPLNTVTTYEFEIEYVVKRELVQYFSEMLTDSIGLVLNLLVNDTEKLSYVPLREDSRIRDLYNKLYIKEPKPVNLSRNITPDLQSLGYCVTNKLDGERFILFFTNTGFYAFNSRKMEKYNGFNYPKFIAMDSEFFKLLKK